MPFGASTILGNRIVKVDPGSGAAPPPVGVGATAKFGSSAGCEDCGCGLAPLQSRTDSEVISPTAMAGGNTGLVLCQVGGQYSGQ